MEVKNRLNAFELQPVAEQICKVSDQPTRWNLRLVSKLWKQEVDPYVTRSYQRQVFDIPEVFGNISQYLDISDRIGLSLTCTTLYAKTSDYGSIEKDMEKYNEKRTQLTESTISKLTYYSKHVNKLNYLGSAILGGSLFTAEGSLMNIIPSFYHMLTLNEVGVKIKDYLSVKNLLETHDEKTAEAIGSLFKFVGKLFNMPEMEEKGVTIKEITNALSNPHSIEDFIGDKTKINILFADNKSGTLSKLLISNKWKVLAGSTIVGAFLFAMYQKQEAKKAFLPEWDAQIQEFQRTATMEIPNELLERLGIRRELLPPFPVYCNCTFIDSKLEMKFFTNEEEELECTHGGHIISLEESKQDLQNKICSNIGFEVTKKSHIPFMTVIIDLQREETKKEILS